MRQRWRHGERCPTFEPCSPEISARTNFRIPAIDKSVFAKIRRFEIGIVVNMATAKQNPSGKFETGKIGSCFYLKPRTLAVLINDPQDPAHTTHG